jgi:hypothetical protein
MFVGLFQLNSHAIHLPLDHELFEENKIEILNCGHLIDSEDFAPHILSGLGFIAEKPEAVYAIQSGVVLHINPLHEFLSCELLIADSLNSTTGWLYRYLDTTTLNVTENQYIEAHTRLGTIYSNEGTIHNNFLQIFRVRYEKEEKEWIPFQNPLIELKSLIKDTIPPKIVPFGEDIFRLKKEESNTYISPNKLYGDVDILLNAYDNISNNITSVYKIEYEIFGETEMEKNTIILDNLFSEPQNLNQLYEFNLRNQPSDIGANYIYNITNLIREKGCWQTTNYPDGNYTVRISVYDISENDVSAEMDVEIRNDPITDLSYFTATYDENCVILDWETENEAEGVRYEIYRNSYWEPEKFAPITQHPIEGMGAYLNSRYSYIDTDINSEYLNEYIYELHLLRDDDYHTILQSTNITEEKPTCADFLKIYQNQPNPFNPETDITYELFKPGTVTVKIYDSSGKMIKKIRDMESQSPGTYPIHWDGTDDSGIPVSSGIYFCQIDINPLNSLEIYSDNIRMILLK